MTRPAYARPAPGPSPLDQEIADARAVVAELERAYAEGMAALGRAELAKSRSNLYVQTLATVELTPELASIRTAAEKAGNRVAELIEQRRREWVATL